MDGRGRTQNNIFIERLWWTLKYKYIYLRSVNNGTDLRKGLRGWFLFYIQERFHQALDDLTPDEVFYGLPHPFADAAVRRGGWKYLLAGGNEFLFKLDEPGHEHINRMADNPYVASQLKKELSEWALSLKTPGLPAPALNVQE